MTMTSWVSVLLVVGLALCLPLALGQRRGGSGRWFLAVLLAFPFTVWLLYRVAERRPVHELQALSVENDLATWNGLDVLGFRPESTSMWAPGASLSWASPSSWVGDTAGAELRTEVVGSTRFTYWTLGDGGRLVGYSGLEPTAEFAERSALESAQEKLALLSLVELKRQDPRLDVKAALPLAYRLAGEDRFRSRAGFQVERAERPYGDPYRAAVLLNTNEELVKALSATVSGELRRGWAEEQKRVRLVVLGTAGLLVVGLCLFLVYAFVNAGTKGYFAWPLRILSAGVFLATVVAAVYIYSNLGKG